MSDTLYNIIQYGLISVGTTIMTIAIIVNDFDLWVKYKDQEYFVTSIFGITFSIGSLYIFTRMIVEAL